MKKNIIKIGISVLIVLAVVANFALANSNVKSLLLNKFKVVRLKA